MPSPSEITNPGQKLCWLHKLLQGKKKKKRIKGDCPTHKPNATQARHSQVPLTRQLPGPEIRFRPLICLLSGTLPISFSAFKN